MKIPTPETTRGYQPEVGRVKQGQHQGGGLNGKPVQTEHTESVTLSTRAQHLSQLDDTLKPVERSSENQAKVLDMEAIQELERKQEEGFLTGKDNLLGLGWMFLDNMSSDWQQKGLELTEASVLEMGRTVQAAFREAMNQSEGKAASIGVDVHGVVRSQQDVPAWFIEEHAQALNRLPPDIRQDYRDQLYHIAPVVG